MGIHQQREHLDTGDNTMTPLYVAVAICIAPPEGLMCDQSILIDSNKVPYETCLNATAEVMRHEPTGYVQLVCVRQP